MRLQAFARRLFQRLSWLASPSAAVRGRLGRLRPSASGAGCRQPGKRSDRTRIFHSCFLLFRSLVCRPGSPVSYATMVRMNLKRRRAAGRSAVVVALLLCGPDRTRAQTMAVLEGHVFDALGAVVPGAVVSVRQSARFAVAVRSDVEGRYAIVAIPVGTYEVEAAAAGFRSEIIEVLTIEVGRTVVRDFHLAVGDTHESVVVRA